MAVRENARNLFAPMYELYLSHTGCDLILVSGDNVKFAVHSIVAAATFPNIRQEMVGQKQKGLLACMGIRKPKKKTKCILKEVNSGELRLLIRYSYLGTCDLSHHNCELLVDLLRAVLNLQIPDLAIQILAYFETHFTTKAALKLFALKGDKMMEKAILLAEEHLLRHFLEENESELLHMDLTQLISLLEDDRLHMQYEEQVWEAMETWVGQDMEERVKDLDKLIKCLRIGLIPEDFLQTKIMSSPLIEANPKALNHLQLASKVVNDWIGKKEKPTGETPSFVRPRIPHQTVVVLGGFQTNDQQNLSPVGHLEFYNINSDSWIKVSGWDMDCPRGFFAAEKVANFLYVIGGFNSEEPVKSCQKLDLRSDQWTDLPPMTRKRCYVSTVVLNGEIYAAGGQGAQSHEKTRTVEKFNPADNAWSQVADMISTRSDAALVNLNGTIFALGGFDGQLVLCSVEKFLPGQKVWTFGPRMVRPRSGLAAVVLDGTIFAFGGFDGYQQLADGERFDPGTNTWTLLSPMTLPRSNFGLVGVDRLIYAVGGFKKSGENLDEGTPLKEVEVYDPTLDKWYRLENLSVPRAGLACFVVDSLQFSLKVWGSDQETRKCPASRQPAFRRERSSDEKNNFPEERTDLLKVPELVPLPEDWLRKYRERPDLVPALMAPVFGPMAFVTVMPGYPSQN